MKPNSTFDLEKHLEQICRVNYENKENKDEPDDNTAPYNVDLKPYCSFEGFLEDISRDKEDRYYSFDPDSFNAKTTKEKLLNIEKEYIELFFNIRGLQFPETFTQFTIILLEISNEDTRKHLEHLSYHENSKLCREYPKLALFFADFFTDKLEIKYLLDSKKQVIVPSGFANTTLDKVATLDNIEHHAASVFFEVMTERILKENILDYVQFKK